MKISFRDEKGIPKSKNFWLYKTSSYLPNFITTFKSQKVRLYG